VKKNRWQFRIILLAKKHLFVNCGYNGGAKAQQKKEWRNEGRKDNRSVTMTQDQIILELIKLLKQNNMYQEANYTVELCTYVDSLEKTGFYDRRIKKCKVAIEGYAGRYHTEII